MTQLIVGFSRIRTWRRCHRLYNYKYVQFLMRKLTAVPLIRGTILHRMIDARAKGKDPALVLREYEKTYRKLFLEQREEYGDLIEDCRQIYLGWVEHWKSDGMKVIESEHQIQIPIAPGIIFQGTIDKVLQDMKRRRWIADHKSHKNLPGDDQRFGDIQTVMYVWAWNTKYPRKPVDGVLWDYLRTKLPAIPEVLKSGKLSQRSNIDTTYNIALRTVNEHCKKTKEDPADYAEWLEGIKKHEGVFYKRVPLPSPPRLLVERIVQEMTTTAIEMQRVGEVDDTRNMTKDCSWCEFRQLCQAELRGQDSDFIRNSDFIINKELADAQDTEEEV